VNTGIACPNCGVTLDAVGETDMRICPGCKCLAWHEHGQLQWRVPAKLSREEAAALEEAPEYTACPHCGAEMTIIEDVETKCPDCSALVSLDQGDLMWRTIEDQLGIDTRVDTGPPAPALEGVADRSSGMLTIKCPHCGRVNEFPGWSEMFIFICDQCGDPVKVVERIQ
jgi:phage FluMu protein Com